MSKNTTPKFFPWVFRVAKFLGQKNITFCILVRVQNSINQHHCPVRNLMMLFLLPDGPCGSITSKSLSVCTHEPPGMINKPPDYIGRACIKVAECDIFHLCKILLGYLSITILDPSPVLKQCIRLY